ncbi:hypothetical protein NIES2111_23950 [Nostoc sp. NIES-2111]|nr:hypothetical protein NIES2111_23950 [Nostoc sp. NIES-2111]
MFSIFYLFRRKILVYKYNKLYLDTIKTANERKCYNPSVTVSVIVLLNTATAGEVRLNSQRIFYLRKLTADIEC